MKYAVLIPVGAGDEPLDDLGQRTPLEAAGLPALDALAREGRLGTAHTFPDERRTYAETSLLSVLGYDPRRHPAGRGVIEGYARGFPLEGGNIIWRANLVTVRDGVLVDHTAGMIRTAEAMQLATALNESALGETVAFHADARYRLLCTWRDPAAIPESGMGPPTEALGQPVTKYLPRGRRAAALHRVFEKAAALLCAHDVNIVRSDLGELPATAVWMWGEGPLPRLEPFEQRYGSSGVMIAGTRLAQGLARCIGWKVLEVPGANGFHDTDFAGKGRAAVQALDEWDLVGVHVQAPDTAAHLGWSAEKVRALEAIDRQIVAPLADRLRDERRWRMLVIPAHATSTRSRRHQRGATVLLMAGSGLDSHRGSAFDEASARDGEVHSDVGYDLMEYFLRR